MKRKVVNMIAMISAMAMLVTGCGGSTTSTTGSNDSSQQTGESVEEPVEFTSTYIMTDWGGEADNFEILAQMQEDANVEISWLNYNSSDWETQKNLVITGGNLPDVFTGVCLTSSDISKYAEEGMLLDLTDLIEEYMPNFSQILEENPYLKAMITNPDDGGIYTLPNVNGRTVSRTTGIHYINKTWLDNLGLEVPTTTEEYYEVLTAFKEQDANGNGDPNDEIPFSCYANSSTFKAPYSYSNLFGAFGYADTMESLTPHYVQDENGEIVFVPTTEGYKEAIQYMHRLVDEGLWDVESFTFTALSQLVAKGSTSPSTLGSFVGYEKQFVVSAENLDEYVVLEPLVGPDGVQSRLENGWTCTDMGQVNTTYVQLTVNAQGKEEAILGFYDLCYDSDYAVQLFLGVDGTVISKDEEGKYSYNDTPEGVTWSEFRYQSAPVWFPLAIFPENWDDVVPQMDEDVLVDGILTEYYDDYLTVSSLFVAPTMDESKIINSTGEDINNYIDLTQAQWIVEGGIEEEWDAYLASLSDLGIDDYTQLVKDMAARMEE
ncbi:MAG: extracellular solute-binding protein [Eubacteriales bacterium]